MGHEGSPASLLVSKLRKVKHGLLQWCRTSNRNEHKVICQLKEELRSAYQQPVFDGVRIRVMEAELKQAVKNEESYWRTKSRVQWLKKCDKNTKFFHAQTMKKRRRNTIRGLEMDDGTWCTDRMGIQNIAIQYFQSLFTTTMNNPFDNVIQCMPSRVGSLENQILVAPVLDVEIEDAIYQMHPSKSLGPDGFNAGFFHHHWEVVGGVVIGMVKTFFQTGRMLKEVNHTNIVLIPKVDNPKRMTQFRPISL